MGSTSQGRTPVVEGEGLLNDTGGGWLASFKALEDHGARLPHWRRLRKDAGYARKVAQVMIRGGIAETIDERLARRIMGENFFGSASWAELYGVTFSTRQLKAIGRFPWSEEVLDSACPFNPGKAIRETHFVFLGLDRYNGPIAEAHGPLTITAWQKIHPAESQPRFYSYVPNCWYPNEQFAAVTLDPCWYLGLKEIVPRSSTTSWTDMQGMIPEVYEVPSPIVEVTKSLLYHKRIGDYLNRNHYGATSALDSGGGRVVVGCCHGGAVGVDGWGGSAFGGVGLSLVRKSGA